MAQYKTGTVDVTNGSAVVTGNGTSWTANVAASDGFTVVGDGVAYDVASVDSDTQITLSSTYQGTSDTGVSYAIWRDFTSPDNIPELSQGDLETATIFTRAMRRIQTLFDAAFARLTGGNTFSGAQTFEDAVDFQQVPTVNSENVYHESNILGTVSQSGGTPTGAIIETDSGPNGRYVKYADGTLECFRVVGLGGSLSLPVDSTWTFPEPFSSPPAVTGIVITDTGVSGLAAGMQCGVKSLPTSTAAVFSVDDFSGSYTTNSVFISQRATGRWF